MEMIGESAGSYRIVRKLGEGGMGVVYLAEHPLLGKKAAVKMLLPELSADPDMLKRFFNEARATTLLNHPGIIEVFDYGTHQSGSAFIVMEFLDGESLAARLRRERRLSTNLVLEITRQVAHAVAAAHAKGIIHRDLKPDNIFLLADTDHPSGIRVKVLDFGIAKLTTTSISSRTQAGVLLGTPAYMSPEQCQGASHVDPRTDIYALGCIMYEMAVGHAPYRSATPVEVILAHLREPVPPLEPEGVDPTLAEVIRRAMAKKVEERCQTMAELAAACDEAAAGRTPSGPYQLPTSVVTSVVAPSASTTLGHVAGEVVVRQVERAHRSRRGLWGGAIAGALVLVAGAASGVWWLAARRPPAVVSVPVAPARTVRLAIDTVPSGAEVFRASDGIRVGRTPYVLQLPPAPGEAVFVLRLDGYLDGSLALPADRDGEASVALVKAPVHTSGPGTRAAGAGSTGRPSPARTPGMEKVIADPSEQPGLPGGLGGSDRPGAIESPRGVRPPDKAQAPKIRAKPRPRRPEILDPYR